MTIVNEIGMGRIHALLGGDDDGGTGEDRVRSAGQDIPLRSPREGHPIGANTGFVPIDVLGDCLDRLVAPFTDAPPPEQGTAGAVAQYAGGVMGVLGAPAEILDTAMSQIPLPSLMEVVPFPAASILSPHMGLPHGHLHPPSLTPPAPMIPLPSFGMPMTGCMTVLIQCMPALRCGDLGLGVTCVSAAPAFEVMTGSRNVFIGGSRAARSLDMTVHCNPIALVTVASAVMDIANVAVGAANAVAHGVAASSHAGAADTAQGHLDEAAAEGDVVCAAAFAAEAAGQSAQAVGEAIAAAAAALDAANEAREAMLKALLGSDPGVAPGVGVVGMGSPRVLIGGASMPSASTVMGELRASFARRSCTSRSRFVRWLGRRVGTPNCG